MKSDRFYLACFRDNVGTNVAFHCKDGCGYSTDISKAHVYTREEAQHAWEMAREFDQPLCADRIDALTEWHVDCQYIPTETTLQDGCTEYVAYQRQRWNGNDVYWLSDGRLPTCNFELATVFPKPIGAGTGDVVWVPLGAAEAAKRRTIDTSLINLRSMCQAAGLIIPERIKRMRRRLPSGKTRWNCPGCGRIHWQYNPYDFDGCSNAFCDEWKPFYERDVA